MLSEATRICEWCGNPYTFIRQGRGRPPSYCSEACRIEAHNSIESARIRRKRWKDKGQTGPAPINPVGRPPKGGAR